MKNTTFGSSPAALILADILTTENNAYLSRKVSCKLHDFTERLNDILYSNLSGHTARWAIQSAWVDFQDSMEMVQHEKAKTYALNIGKRHWQESIYAQRRAEETKKFYQAQSTGVK